MNKLLLLFFALLITSFSGFCQQKIQNKNIKKTYQILFIGNSLTYSNNLPKLVKNSAKINGIIVNTKMIALPNYAIEDHWNDGKVQKLISNNKFDFVLIQQGPSSQNDGRKMLIEYGEKYSKLCNLNNSKLFYFMVWSSVKYYHTFEGVIKNHKDAALLNNSILIPVGEKWKKFIDNTQNFEYHGIDGFHPSLKGSEIAANEIVKTLFLAQ